MVVAYCLITIQWNRLSAYFVLISAMYQHIAFNIIVFHLTLPNVRSENIFD